MRRGRFHWLVLVGLLAASSCSLTLTSFVVPATVQPNQLFEVVVTAQGSGTLGEVGAVLQLPAGFSVVGAAHLVPGSSAITVVRDDPGLLGRYTAEPGHYLASWSSVLAVANPTEPRLKVFVQAPPTTGTATIKVSLAGQPGSGQPFAANSPANVYQFAQITAPTNVRSITVTNALPAAFALDAVGLPVGNPTAWSGIALADVDGDGDDDLAGIAAPSNGPRCWLRPGPTWIESSTGMATAPSTLLRRVACGDFDGDGFLDIGDSLGRVCFGNGGTGWTASANLPIPAPAIAVAAGDVDGDGIDDLALANGGFVVVFLGSSNRTFTPASGGLPNVTTGGYASLLVRDVTGDGAADIVWALQSGCVVFAGNGLGTWTAGNSITPIQCLDCDAGDLDGDGTLELVLAGSTNGPGAVHVYRHLGGNQWASAASVGNAFVGCRSVALLDDDGDGLLDIAAGLPIASIGTGSTGGITLFRNTGAFTFQLAAGLGLPTVALGDVADLVAGDVNGDTFPDLAAAIAGEGLFVWQNWRAGLAPFGSGCQGTLGQPLEVHGTSAPTVGNTAFAVRLTGGPPASLGWIWLGVSAHTWNGAPMLPLDLGIVGAFGCTLLVGPEAIASTLFDASGAQQLGVPIPANPALQGATVFAQGAAVATASNPLWLAFSGGLAIRIR